VPLFHCSLMGGALAATMPLAHPKSDTPPALATDASNTHISGVLQQQVHDHGQPLDFFSRRLTVAEANYSTFGRELQAAQQAINHILPLGRRLCFPVVDRPQAPGCSHGDSDATDVRMPTTPPHLHFRAHM
jgi:hypothetical protein